ncbi:MAG: hypothetical protein HKN87_10040 [Saprospiraceae bacterium]|nr:hypothetical protein [Saprospiraceae bacterium]
MAGTSAFLFNIDRFSLSSRWIASVLIILSVTAIGGIFEMRRLAYFLEWARWILIWLGVFGFLKEGMLNSFTFYSAVMLGASALVWFMRHAQKFGIKHL